MLTINLYGGSPALILPQDSDETLEDVVVAAARVMQIGPLCRHLFGLRNTANALWIGLSRKISTLPENSALQFRLRFRASSLNRLKTLDPSAFEYFFHQVRADFLASEISELIKNPEDGLGLVVTDILLSLLNNPGKKVGDIDLKSFMPKELNGMANRLNVKRNAEKLVEACQKKDAGYVRERYLCKVEESQCKYCTEEYILQRDEGGTVFHIKLSVDPYHADQPGLRYCYAAQKKGAWTHLCRLDELVFVSTHSRDLTVEVSRKTGVPCYFKLQTIDELESFIGCLSGYYRLISTWTFDLCRELSTPSLVFLRRNKCHGPVGSTFSAKKLKEKGGGDTGVGLLRESSTEYDTYYLDVVTDVNKPPVSHTILKEGNKFHLKDSDIIYDSLSSMVKEFIKSDNPPIKLVRILPSSDYDDSELLLLCASRDRQVESGNHTGPRVISMKHLTSVEENIVRGRYSDLVRAKWTIQGNKEVAVKMPKLTKLGDTERFLAVLNEFSFVNCECIVEVQGVTLSPLSLVMEYLPMGPLDKYLQTHKNVMKEVELVEAATYLARALWYLNVEGICHNNIRCHNIFVIEHTDQTFKVKLGDPGLVRYDQRDLHWIPREHHFQPPLALADTTTDIWAFSTTVWQIFSMGEIPLPGADMEEVRKLYATGRLLPRPDPCPQDLYKVMLRCWSPDPQARRQPQAIMRDVNQILYQVFNSRKNHAYQTILPANPLETDATEEQNGEVHAEDEENASVTTQLTTLTYADGSVAQVTLSQLPDGLVDDLISFGSAYFTGEISPHIYETGAAFSPPIMNQGSKTKTLSEMLLPPLAAERIPQLPPLPTHPLQLDKSAIRFGIKIGEGNYGEVHRGLMTDDQGQTKTVAIKTLKAVGQVDDFKREVDIMKKLKHRNIVKLCGLVESEGEDMYMVMEYLPMGSLKDYIKTNKEHMKDSSLLKFAMDIAEGMDYLEQRRVIHRDLAARNILVADQHNVKITDFGLAQQPNRGNYYFRQTQRALPLPWYAPECIEKGKFSHKSDVWSYGVTCWEMFTRGLEPDLPQKPETLLQLLKNGKRLNLKPPCPPNIYLMLIRPCWDEEPSGRPNFSEVITIVREQQDGCL
ncbi:tyrosine-protein kinase hopscotch-like [Homarus americanus]|uniref:tyrosine-protein kinase hopscotch-like n=1 Tax=Homarus americanus TaxID=6706 RepID=UPI001C45D626|nr:tyrosine-protein kinase hopscotch-like [Homarus americanus]XP_042221340.1 tyrosine-protein kinase hopscotch-like [Homarus americanus]XP_042221341.1 tyrosine-protein kinase hopscotch-like [Homarus americanus]